MTSHNPSTKLQGGDPIQQVRQSLNYRQNADSNEKRKVAALKKSFNHTKAIGFIYLLGLMIESQFKIPEIYP